MTMCPKLELTSPPAEVPVSLAEAKAYLRLDASDEDDLLTSLVQAATDRLERRDGILGRPLVTQTWSLVYPVAPIGDLLELPMPEVQSVSSITYYDTDNASQTFSSSDYRLVSVADYSAIELVQGSSWPSVYTREDAMTVSVVAGYGAASAVPEPIKVAIKMLAAHWFENRGVLSIGTIAPPMQYALESVLMPYRTPQSLI